MMLVVQNCCCNPSPTCGVWTTDETILLLAILIPVLSIIYWVVKDKL